MKQWLKEVVHNCVVHPALPFLPVKVGNWLHQVNGEWAFDEVKDKKKPVIDNQQLAENTLTGRKMLAFIEEVLQKIPASQHPNYPKDSDSNSTPTP